MTPRSDIPASPSQALDDKRICRDIYATALMSLLIPPLIGGTTMGLVGYYPLPELYLIFLSHSGIYVLAVGIGVLLSARTACRWITGLPRLRDAASLVRAQKRLARLPWLMLGFLAVYFGAILVSGAVSLRVNRNNPDYSSIGASDAASGLVLSFCCFYPFQPIYFLFIPFGIPAILYGALFILISARLMERTDRVIAHEGHLGGAVAGAALTVLMKPEVITRLFS